MKKSFSNAEVTKIKVGIPDGHKHLRMVIETSDEERFTFQEATIAGIVRAYTAIKTHPQKKAAELQVIRLEERKPCYAEYQLMETERTEISITKELAKEL